MSYTDRDTYGMYRGIIKGGAAPSLMGTNTLVGSAVYNHEQEDLGDIKDLVLDMHSGQLRYAVLAFGGFLGIGESLFAVRWQAFKFDVAGQRFMLSMSKQRLADAPGFDRSHWPDMRNPKWIADIDAFYGSTVAERRMAGSAGSERFASLPH